MKYTNKRSGIALIVVLGFLAIMLVMGLAFSVSMRTERLASEVARDSMQVGQLLRAGVADALNFLNQQYLDGGAKRALPKQEALLESTALSGDPQTKLGPAIDLCGGEASEWIPAKFLNSVDVAFDAVGRANNNAEWVLVKDTAPGADDRILGRYGYLVFDCTGQLDANAVDDTSVRSNGTRNTRSIRINSLPEVNNAANFRSNRQFFNIFGTFPEIMLLNDGVRPTYSCYSEELAALDPLLLNNFCSYSWCYDRGWWNGTQWQNYGDASALVQSDFEGVGYDSTDAGNLVAALTHYVDADKNCNPNGICYEAVPMITEVAVSNTLDGVLGVTIQHTVHVTIEVWYPFPANIDNNDYHVRLVGLVAMERDHTGAPVGLIPLASDLPISSSTFKPSTDGPVIRKEINITKTVPWPWLPWGPGSTFGYSYRAGNPVVELYRGAAGAGTLVDRVSPPNIINTMMNASVLPSVGSYGVSSVNDPRLNHLPASWSQNVKSDNKVNDNIPNFNVSQNGMYEGCSLYVRDGALVSVDELGYLFMGQPWTSIDLFSPEGANLLDRYTVAATIPTAKDYTNGLVNPNSHFGEVLKALFMDVPYEPSPVPTVTNRLTDVSKVEYLTNAMMAASSITPYSNSVEWTVNAAFQPGGALEPADCSTPYSNQEKDAIIRNTYRLFNAQQNLHTVLVVAQGINDQGTIGTWEESEDSVTGEKRAVAVVWRDPFPDANGNYEVLIRQFKYLDE